MRPARVRAVRLAPMRTPILLPLVALAAGLAYAGPLATADGTPAVQAAPAASTRGEQVAALRKEWDAVLRAYWEPFQSIKDEKEAQARLEKNPPPDPAPWMDRAWAVFEAEPKDEAAVAALRFMLEQSSDARAERGLDIVLQHQAGSDKLADLVSVLQRRGSSALPRLREFAAKSTSRIVQGVARRACASLMLEDALAARRVQETEPGLRAETFGWMSPAELEAATKVDAAALQAEAEALLELVIKDYGDVPVARGGTLGKACERELYALRNLAIGKTAPDIEGKDLDGVAFKLSDYRGKVVVLDFWGDW